MSDFYADDKKEGLPGDWQQWVSRYETADALDQTSKDTFFGVTSGSENSEPGTETAAADVPAGELSEGMA